MNRLSVPNLRPAVFISMTRGGLSGLGHAGVNIRTTGRLYPRSIVAWSRSVRSGPLVAAVILAATVGGRFGDSRSRDQQDHAASDGGTSVFQVHDLAPKRRKPYTSTPRSPARAETGGPDHRDAQRRLRAD